MSRVRSFGGKYSRMGRVPKAGKVRRTKDMDYDGEFLNKDSDGNKCTSSGFDKISIIADNLSSKKRSLRVEAINQIMLLCSKYLWNEKLESNYIETIERELIYCISKGEDEESIGALKALAGLCLCMGENLSVTFDDLLHFCSKRDILDNKLKSLSFVYALVSSFAFTQADPYQNFEKILKFLNQLSLTLIIERDQKKLPDIKLWNNEDERENLLSNCLNCISFIIGSFSTFSLSEEDILNLLDLINKSLIDCSKLVCIYAAKLFSLLVEVNDEMFRIAEKIVMIKKSANQNEEDKKESLNKNEVVVGKIIDLIYILSDAMKEEINTKNIKNENIINDVVKFLEERIEPKRYININSFKRKTFSSFKFIARYDFINYIVNCCLLAHIANNPNVQDCLDITGLELEEYSSCSFASNDSEEENEEEEEEVEQGEEEKNTEKEELNEQVIKLKRYNKARKGKGEMKAKSYSEEFKQQRNMKPKVVFHERRYIVSPSSKESRNRTLEKRKNLDERTYDIGEYINKEEWDEDVVFKRKQNEEQKSDNEKDNLETTTLDNATSKTE